MQFSRKLGPGRGKTADTISYPPFKERDTAKMHANSIVGKAAAAAKVFQRKASQVIKLVIAGDSGAAP